MFKYFAHFYFRLSFSCSVAQLCPTLCLPMHCSRPGFPVLHHLKELTQTHVHRVGDAIQPSHLLLFPLLPSIFPSIRVFSIELALHIGWPNIGAWALASVLPVNIQDWFPLGWIGLISLQSKGLLRVFSSSKISILLCSAFFMVQLSHPYMATGKTIALTRWTLAGKVISLPFNMLSRLVLAFLPRSKHLLISWLQSCSLCWNRIYLK